VYHSSQRAISLRLSNVVERTATNFHSGHRPESTSTSVGSMSTELNFSVSRAAGFQPSAATASIARISLTSTSVFTLWQ
jgi:hypothetical protein